MAGRYFFFMSSIQLLRCTRQPPRKNVLVKKDADLLFLSQMISKQSNPKRRRKTYRIGLNDVYKYITKKEGCPVRVETFKMWCINSIR